MIDAATSSEIEILQLASAASIYVSFLVCVVNTLVSLGCSFILAPSYLGPN